jgi:CDP-diacylglycerol--serine O-phosphatidyltransferase
MKLFTIPNILTLVNLLLGCVSVTFAVQGNLTLALGCIVGAAVCDFLDGFAARLLHRYSDIGKQLDSLADLISFGFAPAFMLFMAIKNDTSINVPALCTFFPFLLVAFSALRLAKFNIDERQTSSFIGLPTPANGLFFSTLAILYVQQGLPLWFAAGLVAVFSYLLISEIPMFSLKMRGFSFKKYGLQYAFLVIAVSLLTLWGIGIISIICVPLIIITYISMSFISAIYNKF